MRISQIDGAPARPGPTGRLVVAPHADDEAFGCGGLLAKHPHDSAVLVLAAPDAVRTEEFRAAQQVLGFRTAYFLDLPDGSVGNDMHGLVGLIDEVLDHCRPHELYLPYPSAHQDHIAAYEAGIRSARLSMTEGHWFPPSVLVYDVPAYDLTLYPSDLRWNIFESLEERHIDAKVRALRCYCSQLVSGPHPVNDVKQQAHTLGVARRVAWAERFALVRAVRPVDVPAEAAAAVPAEVPAVLPLLETAARAGQANGHPNGHAANGHAANGHKRMGATA